MVRHLDKVLEAIHLKTVPEATSEAPRVASDTLALNLFDIDPRIKREKQIHIDLDLDQLEDAEE